jgi:4-amino-4-deoxy-L-arabinose transferase-like glycosyltransferase
MENKLKFKNLKFKNNIWTIIFLGLAILVVFFFLRLFHLTILPIFADEAIYIRWSQVMRAEPTLRFLPLSDGKQPLFMWLTIPFLKIFNDPLFAGRFLSILAGLGSLIGLFFVSWELFKNKWISWLSCFFYSLIPFFVFFDRLALVDSLLMMFGLWLAFLSLWLARSVRLDLSLISGLVLAGALITKSPAVFFALLLPSGLLPGEKLKKKIMPWLGFWFLILALGFGIYNFLLRLGPGFQMIAARNQDYLFTLKEIISHPLDPLKPHLLDLGLWLPNLFTWPILLLVLVGLALSLKTKLRVSLFLLLWFMLPLFAQAVFAKVFTPRYILFTVWPLIIFAAFGFYWLFNQLNQWKKLKKGIAFSLGGLLLLLIVLPSLKYNYLLLNNPEIAPLPRNLRSGHLEEWTAGQGIKESAEFLKEEARENDVFVGTEGFFGTLPDGLQIYLEGLPRIRVIGVGWPVVEVHQSLINSLVDNEVYLLVNQSRLKLKTEEKGLILIKEYPKAVNPLGFQDKLLLFRLDKDYFRQ